MQPRILVVRLDARLGNVVLLTPLLQSLRARFPQSHIDVLGAPVAAEILEGHPAVNHTLIFRKRPWLGPQGPLRIGRHLRARRYHVAIDAGNPTDPSLTQAVITARSGAQHTVGVSHGPFARLYSAPAPLGERGPHEISLRGAVLDVLPGAEEVPTMGLATPPMADREYILLNVGAGRQCKQLSAARWKALLPALYDAGPRVLVIYGPGEDALARAVVSNEHPSQVELAPPTNLAQLRELLARAWGMVTPDSGPMHLAVALGVPTLGLFLATDPMRYGYTQPPHGALDLRKEADIESRVRAWARAATQSATQSAAQSATPSPAPSATLALTR